MRRQESQREVKVHPARRLVCALTGLMAGDSILLLYLLQNAFWIRRSLLAAHLGQPDRTISIALEQFVIYAVCSLAGWVFIGIPTAMLFSARSITGLPWLLKLLVGATLGPLALFLVFVLLGGGHLDFRASFTGTGMLWIYSAAVSTVSFITYSALLRREEARRA